jgi:hypothetical protein
MMNFENCKNDTAKANLTRETLALAIFNAMVAEYGADDVLFINKKVEVVDGPTIAKNTVVIRVGETVNSKGATVDVVATITPEVKNFVEKTDKKNKTTFAVVFDDIVEALKTENNPKGEKENTEE